MSRTFTYTKCITPGLVGFGINGIIDHFASRAEIRDALAVAENSPEGWTDCGGMTLHEDDLRLLLTELGQDAT